MDSNTVYGRRHYDQINGNLGAAIAVLSVNVENLTKCQEETAKSLKEYQDETRASLNKLHDDIIALKLTSKDEIVALKLNNKDEMNDLKLKTFKADTRQHDTTTFKQLRDPKFLIPVFVGAAVFVLLLVGKVSIADVANAMF